MSMAMSVPDWLQKCRQNERWKYTDLSFLADKHFSMAHPVDPDHLRHAIHPYRLQHGNSILLVFANGYFMPALSDMTKLPQNVIVCSISDALRDHPAFIKPYWPVNIDAQKYPFACLNAAMFMDGLFFYLPDHCEWSAPLHLLSVVCGNDVCISHPHHLFVLGERSQLTLVEEQVSLSDHVYLMNKVTTIQMGKAARLDHYNIQQEGQQAAQMAHTFVHQMQDSHSTFTNFSFGSAFARDELIVQLQETGAECQTSGFYHLRNDHQSHHHVDIVHAAPRSKSEMLYKGILDHRSRAVFNGKLYVEKNAQNIAAYQANHHLLLSKEAESYSKPELEIYADDVKCKHGATTGQLDQEALYYMRSRGISREDAVNMLLQGFAEDILQRVKCPEIRTRVQKIMGTYLK